MKTLTAHVDVKSPYAYLAIEPTRRLARRAGVDLLKKIGDEVKQGETLYRIYAEFPADFNFAKNVANSDDGYSIGRAEDVTRAHMEF